MKFRSVSILAAALALAACSGLSDKTVLSGYVDSDSDQVRVICADVDTVLFPENGKFSIELPVSLTTVSSAQVYSGAVGFISDGSKITVDFRSEQPFAESSAKSACASFVKFQKYTYGLQNDYAQRMSEVDQDGTLSEEERTAKMGEVYDAVISDLIETSKATLKANKNNATALVALSNIYNNASPSELLEMIQTLDPALQEDEFVSSIMSSVSASAATAEGSMFTDFEASYNGQTSRLSDYVGKGKYILVDFWASWCGPCKAEMPNLKAVYEKFHGDQFDMLSVAVWDEPEDTIESAAELGIPWNQIINAQKVPTELYGIDGIPHIILFGPDGTILKRNLRGEEIGKTIANYVK